MLKNIVTNVKTSTSKRVNNVKFNGLLAVASTASKITAATSKLSNKAIYSATKTLDLK